MFVEDRWCLAVSNNLPILWVKDLDDASQEVFYNFMEI